MDSLQRVSGLSWTQTLELIPPEPIALAPNFSALKTACALLYHSLRTGSFLTALELFPLILNKSRLAALPQERPDLLEEPVLGQQEDYMQQSLIPTLPRRIQSQRGSCTSNDI